MDKILGSASVSGRITIPASKSQTVRALLIATFANGTSIIRNALDSQDTRSCIEVCQAFGAVIRETASPGGLRTLQVEAPLRFPPSLTVDCGNSGTTLYLAAGMAASTGSKVTFTGDAQLQNRPVGQLLEALEDLGAKITYPQGGRIGYPPFTITGPLRGGKTTIACHTSQYLSALLLGCPMATGTSTIEVSLLNERPYAQMTRAWLDSQGISHEAQDNLSSVSIQGRQRFKPFEATVTGDYSSASFFFCAAAITHGCVTVAGLDRNDPQGDKEILDILEHMGCTVTWTEEQAVTICGPPGSLETGSFDLNAIPDALPVLAATACYAKGTTILGNVPQARIKETDRIAVMKQNLASCGANIEEREDALVIHGTGVLEGGLCSGHDDHRIIMAMAIASLGSRNPITIQGIDAVGVTFPTFFALLDQIKENSR